MPFSSVASSSASPNSATSPSAAVSPSLAASPSPAAALNAAAAPSPAAALSALAEFDFPTALVVSQGGQVLAQGGQVESDFAFASVTKPLVAWSAAVAYERALLDLDAPVGPQLPGATVRHLLAHASGVAPNDDSVLAAPGTKRIYSNRGIELLGQVLEQATGYQLDQWVELSVLEPLGLASILIPGSPAYSGVGNAVDLAAFTRELAAPTLVSADTAKLFTSVAFPGLSGVLPGYGKQSPCDFALGFEVYGAKQPHWLSSAQSMQTFGHFGQAGSFIWVDPATGRSAAFLGAKPFSQVHKRLWPLLNQQIAAL